MLVLGVAWAIGFVPEDYKQGNSARIIYIHVPAAFLSLAGYYIMAIAGAIGLIWRMKLSFMVMKSAAPIGAVLTFTCLVTNNDGFVILIGLQLYKTTVAPRIVGCVSTLQNQALAALRHDISQHLLQLHRVGNIVLLDQLNPLCLLTGQYLCQSSLPLSKPAR